jgi:hypothetical protein
MSIRTTILDYSSLSAALGKDRGRVQESVNTAAQEVAGDPVEQAQLLAAFNNALGKLQEEDKGPGVMSSAQNGLASRMQSYLVERALTEAPGSTAPVAGQVQEVKFDNLDVIGWLPVGLLRIFRPQKFKRPDPSGAAIPIADNLRLAMFADWGSGLYGAPKTRDSIKKAAPDMVMHLGDTYYSGSDREVEERLVGMWPSTGSGIHVALNGNHEMYSGGKPYFTRALGFLNQAHSCVAYQNSNWLLVGLDTAYVDHDMDDAQVAWLTGLINAAGSRKVILFSHHQPFSQMDDQGPKLVTRLGALLTGNRIHAWFWGHEHRCVIYSPHSSWGLKGRCVGHGGFPAFRDNFSTPGGNTYEWRNLPANNNAPAAEVLDGPNLFIPNEESRYSPHGFVTLDFSGAECRERYLDSAGTEVRPAQLL